MVQTAALIPLILVAIIAAAGIQYAIMKKLSAQSLCVRTAVDLQQSLSNTLTRLMRLNPQATQLRIQRANADRIWYRSLASGNPYIIAAARALRTAVILAQTAHQARQQRLLLAAQATRVEYWRRIQSSALEFSKSHVRSKGFYYRALAVEPVPSTSLTPNYVTVAQFAYFQQHQFDFDVDLSPAFWSGRFVQNTHCSVSLRGKEGAWNPQIIAASASLKSQ